MITVIPSATPHTVLLKRLSNRAALKLRNLGHCKPDIEYCIT